MSDIESDDNYEFKTTTWANTTKHEMNFDLFVGPGVIRKVKIPPGGKKSIPSEFDNAIRTVRDGVVIGGKAPLLVPEGQEPVPVHDAIGRGAAAGDTERRVLATTGSTAGPVTMDAAVALQAQNDELKARLAALEAKLAAPVPAQKAQQPDQPAKPAKGSIAAPSDT